MSIAFKNILAHLVKRLILRLDLLKYIVYLVNDIGISVKMHNLGKLRQNASCMKYLEQLISFLEYVVF